MTGFDRVTGRIAPLLAANIDTDVIMPKQFLKGIDRSGLDRGVFFDQRFHTDGSPNPDFVLNKSPWKQAPFLAVGPNFGCGSSREHAVWGLRQLGVRAIVGTSYAGIFFDNCRRNGLLLIELEEADFVSLATWVEDPNAPEVTIDLPNQCITAPQKPVMSFDIDSRIKDQLASGLDPVARTQKRQQEIREFELKHLRENPWLA